MVQAIRQEITVLRENVIEVRSPILKPGTHVEVIVLIEEDQATQKKSLPSLIGTGKGSFASSKEADAFIRGERDKWE